MRKLASIQQISKLEAIPNADNILKATILGWTVVVSKNDGFVEGDKCIFFEIDSVLPADAAWAAFLSKYNFRLKTIRLKGALSQGLALPLKIFPEPMNILNVGVDVTELLSVIKFEPPAIDDTSISGWFPIIIPKTDEIRIQSVVELLQELPGKQLYISTKLDGQSCTFFRPLDGSEVILCKRNVTIKRGDNHLTRLCEKYNLDVVLPPGVAIQGELCGPGIQKNRLGLKEADCWLFNVFILPEGEYCSLAQLIAITGSLKMKTVPIEEIFEANGKEHVQLDWWLERAKGLYENFGDGKNRKEGIVVRSTSNILAGDTRISFKVISNDFLLKDEQ